jgi:hypothetical protein
VWVAALRSVPDVGRGKQNDDVRHSQGDTVLPSALYELATGHGVDDVDHGTGRDARIQPIHESDIFLAEKDVHEGAEFAGFVAEVEANAGMLLLQGVDDFAHRPSRGMDLALIAGALAECNGYAYCNVDEVWILHVVPRGSDVKREVWEVGTKTIVPRSQVWRQSIFCHHTSILERDHAPGMPANDSIPLRLTLLNDRARNPCL